MHLTLEHGSGDAHVFQPVDTEVQPIVLQHHEIGFLASHDRVDLVIEVQCNGMRFNVTTDYYPGNDTQQENMAEYLRPQLKKVASM